MVQILQCSLTSARNWSMMLNIFIAMLSPSGCLVTGIARKLVLEEVLKEALLRLVWWLLLCALFFFSWSHYHWQNLQVVSHQWREEFYWSIFLVQFGVSTPMASTTPLAKSLPWFMLPNSSPFEAAKAITFIFCIWVYLFNIWVTNFANFWDQLYFYTTVHIFHI